MYKTPHAFRFPFAVLLILAAIVFTTVETAFAKPFKRALVIGGGGISPGVSLGLLAGARAAGFEPDIVIVTCGASLGAAIANAYPSDEKALAFAKSASFHQSLMSLTQLDETFSLNLKSKLDEAESHPGVIPQIFSGNILKVPERIGGLLPRETFTSGKTRFIVLASRSSFGPGDVGQSLVARPAFKQIYFTDSLTAATLRGLPSPIHRLFPGAFVDSRTEVMTGVSTVQAARASIADPFFLNPARIGGSYYFTGAIDLFPVETAEAIAQEVLITYPSNTYDHYEDLAVSSAFGFSQNARSKSAARSNHVKWIDISGINDLTFDPTPSGLTIVNNIPPSLQAYAAGVDRQYSFGYYRAQEAVKIQKDLGNVRTHLREKNQ